MITTRYAGGGKKTVTVDRAKGATGAVRSETVNGPRSPSSPTRPVPPWHPVPLVFGGGQLGEVDGGAQEDASPLGYGVGRAAVGVAGGVVQGEDGCAVGIFGAGGG
ncbi:hypothetical protein [Streptomyces sp. NPDC002346]